MTIINARPAEDIDEARFPGAVDEARGAGHRDDAPEESATDQPAAATEPADEDQALPVEADLAGETAVALTQASSTDAEPGDAPAVAEAAEAVARQPTAVTTPAMTPAATRPVSSSPPTTRTGSCTSTPPR